MTGETTTGLRARPLDESTWPDFAALVERHNGVWGGCWCMGFHAEGVGRSKTAAQNRAEKEARVREGRAHAALVYDGPADGLKTEQLIDIYGPEFEDVFWEGAPK